MFILNLRGRFKRSRPPSCAIPAASVSSVVWLSGKRAVGPSLVSAAKTGRVRNRDTTLMTPGTPSPCILNLSFIAISGTFE